MESYSHPSGTARLLLLADSHLGFDLPRAPRVNRRRRGPDFVANYHAAVERALAGDIDLLIHGGDLLFRSKVPAWLTELAMAPLRRLADSGVPVFVVPGNHERSHIPHPLLARHPRIHIFDRPRTFSVVAGGLAIAVTGLPYQRSGLRSFTELVRRAITPAAEPAVVRLLCLHQCVEGARVGPHDYTFRRGDDVIAAADLPADFAAVLAGHIHRHQVLTRDPTGQPLATPVFYPGSIERTSFAERDEDKGYLILDLCADPSNPGGRVAGWRFCRLPARPMLVVTLATQGADRQFLRDALDRIVAGAPRDAVVKLELRGALSADARPELCAANLRALAPPTMDLSVAYDPARS